MRQPNDARSDNRDVHLGRARHLSILLCLAELDLQRRIDSGHWKRSVAGVLITDPALPLPTDRNILLRLSNGSVANSDNTEVLCDASGRSHSLLRWRFCSSGPRDLMS